MLEDGRALEWQTGPELGRAHTVCPKHGEVECIVHRAADGILCAARPQGYAVNGLQGVGVRTKGWQGTALSGSARSRTRCKHPGYGAVVQERDEGCHTPQRSSEDGASDESSGGEGGTVWDTGRSEGREGRRRTSEYCRQRVPICINKAGSRQMGVATRIGLGSSKRYQNDFILQGQGADKPGYPCTSTRDTDH
ncbi:hypothetical protein C8R47DRAFT_1088734 [Mycena vitilis]|nr:hypothetical protein C8R47DRAFT_1088734 [Mycena vitilis]